MLIVANTWISTLAVSAVSIILYHLLGRRNGSKQHLPLPPGPPGKPIVGNLHDLPGPDTVEYRHWLKHKDTYGPISSLTVLGQVMVVLHDKEAALDLMERRTRVSSSRSMMQFSTLCAYDGFVTNMSYDDRFRKHRRLMHMALGTRKLIERFQDVQTHEAAHLLLRVLKEPEKLRDHFRSEAGAVILKVGYGYTTENNVPDPLVLLIELMMTNFFNSITVLRWMVDGLPFLKYLPEWLPGMSFKTTAKEWRDITRKTVEIPFDFARQRIKDPAAATTQPTIVAQLIDKCSSVGHGAEPKLSQDDEEAIRMVTGALYGGGAETTVSSMSGFVLAMLRFPEVQRRAQEELDSVVGDGRLPQFEDREKLPYIDAMVKETLRWWSVTPLGIPHRIEADVEYGGYLIPKNALLIPAVRWFTHDPDVYKDPESFDPTRFMSPRDEPDATNVAFGFGRRICPGRHFADASIFITIAQLLAAFRIERVIDAQGNEAEPLVESMPGIVDHPTTFPYRITPRSPKYRHLVEELEAKYPWQPSDSGNLENRSFLKRAGFI